MKVCIGFIIFGDHTAKYLPFFLPSLKNQTEQNFKIIVFNNGEADDENVKYLRANFPEIEIRGGGVNLGFAAAYNQMITSASLNRADYFLMTNPDLILEPDVLEKLAQRLDSDKELGSACPKILKWNFANNEKTSLIDSYGIGLKSGLRFFDVGQGKKDHRDFRYSRIIGPSGACGLFRLAALEKIKENGKYLDERMFMYKEDCDLDYRLYLIHQESACVPEAVVYHDRSAAGTGANDLAAITARKNKSREIKRLSLVNQQLIFKKYWHLQNFISRLNIIFYLIKSFFYSLFFEQYLLAEVLTIFLKKDRLQ
ncbi:MAG: glycosyltransferase family 2 protein [Patescibacteria group bacterium]|nr:glycosyltransferase family 2 protein [Patescibacteria group bacterium]